MKKILFGMAVLISSLLCSCDEKEWTQHDIEYTPVYRMTGVASTDYVDYYMDYDFMISHGSVILTKSTLENFEYAFVNVTDLEDEEAETTYYGQFTYVATDDDGYSITDEEGNVTKTALYVTACIAGPLYNADGEVITDGAEGVLFDATESIVDGTYTYTQQYLDPETGEKVDINDGAETTVTGIGVTITEVYIEPTYNR